MTLLAERDYEALSHFRCGLRAVLGSSDIEARKLGVPPQQHQVLLVLAGRGGSGGMGASALAECLQVKAHTVSEMVSRMVERQLLERTADLADRRRALLRLSAHAQGHLARLAAFHAEELRRLRPLLESSLEKLGPGA